MIPNAKICLYPKDPAEAVRVLADHGPRALILAGGTSAALSRDARVDTLVDLTRMGCDRIERDGDDWEIGCNVRLTALVRHPGLRALAGGALADAAAAVGSRAIRNAVTVAGNLVQLYRWSDTPVALLALDARVDLLGPDGARSLGIDELLARHPRQVLAPAELVRAVRVPAIADRAGAFVKLARTEVDYSVVAAAVSLDREGDRIAAARVVVGGARGRPFRATGAEQVLTGRRPGPARLAAAAVAARDETRAIPDARTSVAYRQRMVEVVVRRALQRALDRGEEGR